MLIDHDHDRAGDPSCDGDWSAPTRPPTGISFVGAFEGRALITCDFDGKPAWLAGEIAAILGLGGASELARKLAMDWADAATEGEHWVRIGALELDELRVDLRDRGVILPPSLAEAGSTLLLLEPGVELVVNRHCREIGRGCPGLRLLHHLHERVIPDVAAIRRPTGSPLEREAAAIVRERIELERRRWEYDALEGLCDSLTEIVDEDGARVDPEVVWAYRVVAAEIVLGDQLAQLKPAIEHGWLSPTQIASRHLGVTPQRVGQVISLLGLRDSKVHSKAVLNQTVGRNRAVISYLYSPAAVGLIERELRSRGYRRVE